jgi:hypothetical protein
MLKRKGAEPGGEPDAKEARVTPNLLTLPPDVLRLILAEIPAPLRWFLQFVCKDFRDNATIKRMIEPKDSAWADLVAGAIGKEGYVGLYKLLWGKCGVVECKSSKHELGRQACITEAARNGRPEILHLMPDHGYAPVGEFLGWKWCPATKAAKNGHVDCLEVFLKKGNFLDAFTRRFVAYRGCTSWKQKVTHRPVAKFLVEKLKISPLEFDTDRLIAKDAAEVLEYLGEIGHPKIYTKKNLKRAIETHRPKVTECLIRAGVSPGSALAVSDALLSENPELMQIALENQARAAREIS